ncbi:MAG: hypothetical protein FWF76_02375 [Oscillospiraceae bacterium]|nr:hypothetical protein [Oscillospiraceae bacterium]
MLKSILKNLPPAIGYLFMGNLLGQVMTFSLAMFRSSTEIMLLATLFSLTIYFLLIAVPAYKDGQNERSKVTTKALLKENKAVPYMYRWLYIGVFLYAIMLIPSIIFMTGQITDGVYRLLSGAVAPLGWILIEGTGEYVEIANAATGADEYRELMRLIPWSAWVFMGLYALTIPACYIGYVFGLKGKFDK